MFSSSPAAPATGTTAFPDPRRERAFLILLAAMQFTHIVDFMILMPMGPLLMESFTLSPGRFGSLVSAYTFSAGIATLIAAIVLDRFDRKRALLVVYAGFITGTLLCGLAPTADTLLAARIVTGGFGGVMVALVYALVGDVIPVQRRGTAMGIVMTAFSVASVVGVPLGLVLSTHMGWQAPFFALAALSVLMWIAAWRTFPVIARARTESNRAMLADFGSIISRATHWRALAFTAVMMGSGFLVIPYISVSLVTNAGVANNQLPWIFLTGGMFTFFSLRYFGKLGDQHGLFRVYALLCLASMIPVVAISHLGPWGLGVALPVTTLFMVLLSGRAAPGMALVTTVPEARLRGGFMSLNTAVQQLAVGTASLISGMILITGPDGSLLRYNVVGWIAVAGLGLSIWIGRGLRGQ